MALGVRRVCQVLFSFCWFLFFLLFFVGGKGNVFFVLFEKRRRQWRWVWVNNCKRNKTKNTNTPKKPHSTSSLHAHRNRNSKPFSWNNPRILGFPQSKAKNKWRWGSICLVCFVAFFFFSGQWGFCLLVYNYPWTKPEKAPLKYFSMLKDKITILLISNKIPLRVI